ncbi:formate dehydrogenase accessory sulfurtransferase FdhD [Bacillus sp. B15-48]|uniref:formate dehydrogenase accessory sulfurtransferase FdhD n=1 Tax=Bacillus sp. B15-48 TaxID=1548601 RepID=UPI0031B89945
MLTYENNVASWVEDKVATEFACTIKINGEEYTTIVCTPDHLEELIAGFLLSEKILSRIEDIKNLWIDERDGLAHVTAENVNELFKRFLTKRYITSCCGKGRTGFYFLNDARTAKVMKPYRLSISIEDCFRMMEQLHQSATVFQETGGVHNAALCDQNGIVVTRADIGRHNALDKIYGYCLQNQISLHDKVLIFSGRISSEILIKCAKIGCEIVVSKSAPTELALDLADQLGITTVGFVRGKSLNIYTHTDRIHGKHGGSS